ncbi:hypothetical protein Hanom_Chr14g01299281 [Helianthus anomalus]
MHFRKKKHLFFAFGPLSLRRNIFFVFLMSKLHILSFMYVPNSRRCPLTSKLTGFVLNVSKSCTLFPLTLTQSIFFC